MKAKEVSHNEETIKSYFLELKHLDLEDFKKAVPSIISNETGKFPTAKAIENHVLDEQWMRREDEKKKDRAGAENLIRRIMPPDESTPERAFGRMCSMLILNQGDWEKREGLLLGFVDKHGDWLDKRPDCVEWLDRKVSECRNKKYNDIPLQGEAKLLFEHSGLLRHGGTEEAEKKYHAQCLAPSCWNIGVTADPIEGRKPYYCKKHKAKHDSP